MRWDVDARYLETWLDEQDDSVVAKVVAAIRCLREEGPNLGRPLVDTIQGSSMSNLKELRLSTGRRGQIRILFAFDPERKAILLVAGNKALGKRGAQKWSGWYRANIPLAERRYEEHLRERG